MSVSAPKLERQNEEITQLIARQVWDEWYRQAEFKVRSSMTKMTIVTKRGKKKELRQKNHLQETSEMTENRRQTTLIVNKF